MTNSVADAVMVLNAIMGKDEADVSSFEQAPFDIEPIDLKGIRLGLVTNLMGYLAEVDDLTVKAVEVLKAHGAEVQDCELTRPGYASRLSYQVMQYEFKAGMASYLQQTNAKYKNLAELIEANEAQREVTLEHFGQEIFEASNKKGDLNDEAYRQAKKQSFELSGPDGIDATLSACQADVLIAPSGSPAWMIDHVLGDHYLGGSAGPAASSGYPHITVPMGFVAGLPVGISFFSGRGSMQKLIGVAMTYEALTQHRALPVQYR